MSSSILEKLKVKPVPKKVEQILVKIVDPEKEEQSDSIAKIRKRVLLNQPLS